MFQHEDGTLSSLSLLVDPQTTQNLGSALATITGELYIANPGQDEFHLLLGSSATGNISYTGIVNPGDISSANVNNLNIPIPAGSRLLYVVKMFTTDQSGPIDLSAYVSGGLGIT